MPRGPPVGLAGVGQAWAAGQAVTGLCKVRRRETPEAERPSRPWPGVREAAGQESDGGGTAGGAVTKVTWALSQPQGEACSLALFRFTLSEPLLSHL